jgi:hypothetical protein
MNVIEGKCEISIDFRRHILKKIERAGNDMLFKAWLDSPEGYNEVKLSLFRKIKKKFGLTGIKSQDFGKSYWMCDDLCSSKEQKDQFIHGYELIRLDSKTNTKFGIRIFLKKSEVLGKAAYEVKVRVIK